MTDTLALLIGRISRPHGIRGEVAIDVRTDSPDVRFVAGAVLRGERAGVPRQLTLVDTRWHSGRLLARFAELPDRTAAEEARGVLLFADVPLDESPEDPDEFYEHQLIGLRVVDQDGVEHGQVTGLTHGAQDLLQVRTEAGEVLVPFVTALVPTIDLAAGVITVNDRPGLLRPLED